MEDEKEEEDLEQDISILEYLSTSEDEMPEVSYSPLEEELVSYFRALTCLESTYREKLIDQSNLFCQSLDMELQKTIDLFEREVAQ